MIAPPGAQQIEYIIFGFRPDILVADLLAFLENTEAVLIVNGKDAIAGHLICMPMTERFSGRFIWNVNYPVETGDVIVVELRGGINSDRAVTIDSEISIVGKLEINSPQSANAGNVQTVPDS